MRRPERLYKFYEQVNLIHMQQFPDWRFGQFMCNVLGDMQSKGRDPFFPEEDEMIEFIEKYVKEKTPF